MVLIKVSSSEVNQLDSIFSDKKVFEENEEENNREKEMSVRPKKKVGRPKGSKNVKKEKSKQEVGETKSEEIQNILVEPCDIISTKTENDETMLTENLVETVLSEIEPGEIIDDANYIDKEEIGHKSLDPLNSNGKCKKRGRPKGSKNGEKSAKMKKMPRHGCNVCGKKIKTSRGLKNHITLVHKKEKPSCPHCDYEYQDMIKLERHINNHTGNRPHVCDQCDYKSLTKHELRRHKNYKHTQTKKYTCPDCGKGFVETSHLRRHKLIHSGERPWPCSQCPLVFQSKFHVDRHVRVHTGEKPYICPTCEQGFTQQGSLKAHIMTHHKSPEEQERFSCNFCTSSYTRNTELRKHTREFHLRLNPVRCKWCDKKFDNECIMRYHNRRNCRDKETSFKCQNCCIIFETRHKRSNHSCKDVTSPEEMKPQVACKDVTSPDKMVSRKESSFETTMDENVEEKGDIMENRKPFGEETSFKCHKCNLLLKNYSQLVKHVRHCVATVTQADVEDITLKLPFDKFEQKMFSVGAPKQNNPTLQGMIQQELKSIYEFLDS